MPAELAFLRAEADAGHVLFDHQARNALRPLLTGADHDDIELVLAAARDELLGAGDDIMIAVADRLRPARPPVRARRRYGWAIARERGDRKSVGWGESVAVRVGLGGR